MAGHPGRTPAAVYFVAVFHLLGYKIVRTELWGPEEQSHHPPIHIHSHRYTHIVTVTH